MHGDRCLDAGIAFSELELWIQGKNHMVAAAMVNTVEDVGSPLAIEGQSDKESIELTGVGIERGGCCPVGKP